MTTKSRKNCERDSDTDRYRRHQYRIHLMLLQEFLRDGRKILAMLRNNATQSDHASIESEIKEFCLSAPPGSRQELCTQLNTMVTEGMLYHEAGIYEITRMLRHVIKVPDRRAEKIVSDRFGFLWICIPKVASRSLLTILTSEPFDGRVIKGKTLEEVLDDYPAANNYFKFCFVRNPYERLYSFYTEKLVQLTARKKELFIDSYSGLQEGMSFTQLCNWIESPLGNFEFADRHYLPMHRQLSEDRSALEVVDYVGKLETLGSDLTAVMSQLGAPGVEIPFLNTRSGWNVTENAFNSSREDVIQKLTPAEISIISSRYRDDFDEFGYAPLQG